MAEQGISRDAMLAGLQDIRLPGTAAGGLAAEVAVVLALGLAVALVLGLLLPLIARLPVRAAPVPSIAERVAVLRALPEEERAVALLHLIRVEAPEALPEGSALYGPGGFPAAAALEAALLRRGSADA